MIGGRRVSHPTGFATMPHAPALPISLKTEEVVEPREETAVPRVGGVPGHCDRRQRPIVPFKIAAHIEHRIAHSLRRIVNAGLAPPPRKQAGQMTAPDRSSTQPHFTLAEQGPSQMTTPNHGLNAGWFGLSAPERRPLD